MITLNGPGFLKHSKVSKDGAYEATRDGKSKKISIVLILCHKMLGKHCHWSVKYRSSLIVMLIVTMIKLMMMAKVVIMMEVKGGGRVGLPASTEQVAAKLDPAPSKILHNHDYHD